MTAKEVFLEKIYLHEINVSLSEDGNKFAKFYMVKVRLRNKKQ